MWSGCVYGALCQRRSLPFQQSFFWQPETQLCVSNSDVTMLKPDMCSKNYQIWSFLCCAWNHVIDSVIHNTLLKITNQLLTLKRIGFLSEKDQELYQFFYKSKQQVKIVTILWAGNLVPKTSEMWNNPYPKRKYKN